VRLRLWLLLGLGSALALVSGCAPEDETGGDTSLTPGPLMRPGWNCLSCHRPQGQAASHVWSAGGTVFAGPTTQRGVAGAQIVITDEDGKTVRLISNSVGNFYTAEPLSGSLAVRVERNGQSVSMPERAPAGSCNFCHTPTGAAQTFIVPP
jgi:hypothetical protein